MYREYGLAANASGADDNFVKVDDHNQPLLTGSASRSWAVITGGSSGIGLAMAKNLAVNSNFNICIIGRNAEKME